MALMININSKVNRFKDLQFYFIISTIYHLNFELKLDYYYRQCYLKAMIHSNIVVKSEIKGLKTINLQGHRPLSMLEYRERIFHQKSIFD